ncbi:MAG: ectoine hydrolase DoeA [Rhodospirillales bacterium]
MAAETPRFSNEEYAARLAATRAAMDAAGIDLLIATDPSNMAWLTGYDGWSFYVHQCVLVPPSGDPIWYGRYMDNFGARRTVYMADDRIIGYPDIYVQSAERHPMDHLSGVIADYGWSGARIGVEMDNYYFSAACLKSLEKNLAEAAFIDATGLVNWRRAVKSETELEYMRRAARIAEAVHARIFELAEPGVRKCDLAAEIYSVALRGAGGHGGDYPAMVPVMPSGADASAAHLTWDETPLKSGEGTFFEIAGAYRRYQCPQSRTVFLGEPEDKWRRAETAVLEGIDAAMGAAKPGNTCEMVEAAWRAAIAKHGLEKESRMGYAIGLSYPPDWGERTMSFRAGDTSELRPNMTFHIMPALWFEDWGLEISEPIVITETGCEPLCNTPRKLFVKP